MNQNNDMNKRFMLEGSTGTWLLTIGLEVHAQIASKAKLFSTASAAFGGDPNTHVSLVDVAFPGMLPVLSEYCVHQALKTSLGLEGSINLRSVFDRKNYFYPDLPQGYQISQFYTPIMQNGHLCIEVEGKTKTIRINRLHIEQDAGKSLHDQHQDYSAVDLNRCGVGLMEIVSEPDLTSPEEAGAYVKKLRSLLQYLETSDGNMEEGSLRVDANVSVAKEGQPLGTRVEIKNLNSIRFMQQAIVAEAGRQITLLESGQVVNQETRLFNEVQRVTKPMRDKEDAQQYRYFPDPDIPPLVLEQAFVDQVRGQLPELPDAKKTRFQKDFSLSAYDAGLLVSDMEAAAFFEEAVSLLKKASPKILVNWLMGEVMAALNEAGLGLKDAPVKPKALVALVEMVATDRLSGKMAKEVFQDMWETGADPEGIVEKKGLKQLSSKEDLMPLIQQVLAAEADKVAAYKAGKDKLFGFFVGQVMKASKGAANPGLLNALLKEALNS